MIIPSALMGVTDYVYVAGVAANPDSITAVLYRWVGATRSASGITVTITAVGDGEYRFTWTVDAGFARTDELELVALPVVSGVTYPATVWRSHGDVSAVVPTVAAAAIGGMLTAPTTANVGTVDLLRIGGDAQSATDLKDFADAGYDPSTNKVQGVALVDTTTTNSDMRGTDNAALAATALSTAVWTNTLATNLGTTNSTVSTNLDVAISVIQAQIAALNNLSAKANWFGSALLEVPDSGTRAYIYELVVRDDEDKLANLDGLPTIALTNAAGTDRSALITTTVANPSTGRYTITITVGTGTNNESLKLTATGTISAETRYAVMGLQVVDYDNATQVALILTRLGTPVVSVSADIAAVKAVADTTVADTNELQTDWANGGRLDSILDARASQASVDALVQTPAIASGTIGTDNNTTQLHLPGLTFGDNELDNLLIVVYDVSEDEYHSNWINFWTAGGENVASLVLTLPFTPQASTDTYVVLSLRSNNKQLTAVQTSASAIQTILTGITSLGDWLRRAFRKDAGTAGMIAAEAEIDTGGTSTFSGVADSLEAIKDASGGGGGGGPTSATAVVVARVPIGATAGWPQELVIGDAYLTTTATSPLLYIKDIDDNILDAMGTKNFSDGDFVGTLRLAPLTTATRDDNTPATTIEVDSSDTPGIVYNDNTVDAEYFELQIPNDKTLLGVIKTRYSAQFILNWGATREFERTINLGEVRFIRKNAAQV